LPSLARRQVRPHQHPGAGPADPRAVRPDGGEVSIAILNHIADWHLVLLNNRGRWSPFKKPGEWAAQVLAFLLSY